MYLGYPKYPDEVWDLIGAVESSYLDALYKQAQDIDKKSLNELDELDEHDVVSNIISIGRGERFCDGHAAEYIDNGKFLRLAERLGELRQRNQCYEEFPATTSSIGARGPDDAEGHEPFDRAMGDAKKLDQVRGCLVGGAMGDALGYTVEFMKLAEIKGIYGDAGITEYALDHVSGTAFITDDTQMTLFTANGILFRAAKYARDGMVWPPEGYIHAAYLDWHRTQTGRESRSNVSWLNGVKELNARRAPGITCMRALESGVMGSLDTPINDSKGCGGVMRVAPIALYFGKAGSSALEGAKAAAITHGHPLGYMTAAALVHIIERIVYCGCPAGGSLYDIVDDCLDEMDELFSYEEYLDEMAEIIQRAVDLSRNDAPDTENIALLGAGWVAEEALAIALYCSLKYQDDFSAAIIAAVNHSGDSDSTGAIAGNIVGALIGYESIPQKWKDNLELRDLILEVADDLYHGCPESQQGDEQAHAWKNKYVYFK